MDPDPYFETRQWAGEPRSAIGGTLQIESGMRNRIGTIGSPALIFKASEGLNVPLRFVISTQRFRNTRRSANLFSAKDRIDEQRWAVLASEDRRCSV